MPKKIEHDSFDKAIKGVVETSRVIAREKEADRVSGRALAKELRTAFRSVVHEFDSLEKGLRKLKPIMGEIQISPQTLGVLPPIIGDVLKSGARALKRQDFAIGIGMKRGKEGVRGLDLSFRSEDHELWNFSLRLTRSGEMVKFSMGLLEPNTAALVSEDAKIFSAHTKDSPQGYANRILMAKSLITYVKGQVEQEAFAWRDSHSKSETG